MLKNNLLVNAYYPVKPYIPRRMQLILRRGLALFKRRLNRHCWPIDAEAARVPSNWGGWPEGKQFSVVLTHDVDTQKGHNRCGDLMNLELEAGLVSSFNFVAGEYRVDADLRQTLMRNGFEVGIHGLYHSAELYESREKFARHAVRINRCLREWQAVGFRSPCMYHNLEWLHALDISYDASTFDTDPFEPQPDGMRTIFPVLVEGPAGRGYVELPYTLPQDFTLFILFREKNIDTWKKKLDWVVRNGGMVLVNTHPDYMKFDNRKSSYENYPAHLYRELLETIQQQYAGCYWHALPRQMADFWRDRSKPKEKKPAAERFNVNDTLNARAYA